MDLGIDRGVEVKASMIAELGNDDVVARSERRWTGAQPPAAVPPAQAPATPAAPEQVVIAPRDGVSVRPSPGTDEPRIGVLQHGTFAEPTGREARDATGRAWIELRSTDVADRPITGWVAAEYTAPHPAGAMDATGRTNPDLADAGYRPVQVEAGDTLWDVARREGVDFQELLALNRDHLIRPDLIFPGDTVYVPAPRGPAPERP
ncbi:LysM peptidoglycan-binding domain-containing protein [Roseomonas sp. CCTCC AB2023176]|uniref:LysM peptidoglycan-binding domain-containing protein n=1 Tax=Roseomonas sp. CCTCC AB2023176 TaxID=3342640 RepID=UPI0035E02250